MYTSGDNKLGNDLLSSWEKGNIREQHAAQYGRALLAMGSNNYDLARKTLQPLLSAEPQNAWYSTWRPISISGKESQTRLTA
jgi:predicted Zn-dependent protease